MKIYDELDKEDEFPAQGAYVGHLLTDYLSSLVTGRLREVSYEDDCLSYCVDMGQYDDDLQLVDTLRLLVTFHRGTIALLCPTEEWWSVMEQSVLFRRLWAIAEHTGCLIGLSAVDTNGARVWDPVLCEQLEGKNVMSPKAVVH